MLEVGETGARGKVGAGSRGSGFGDPAASEGAETGAADNLRWALGYVRPHWKGLGLVASLSLLSTAFSLYLPYLSKSLVDQALLGRELSALIRITTVFLAVAVARFAINVVSGLLYTRISADVLFAMRLDVYRHLQRLSPRFWARTPLGDVISRINNDVSQIQQVAAQTALGWVGNLLFLVGTVAMLVWLDLRLFAVSLILLPPALWALVRYRRRLGDRIDEMRERSAEIGSFLIESLRGIRLVVSSNAQGREEERFRQRNDAFVSALMSMQWVRYLAGGLPGLLLSASAALVFLYGGWRVIAGAISLGTFVAFTAYQMRVLSPVRGLMGLYTGIETARVSLARVRKLLATRPEVEEAQDPVGLERVTGSLRLEDVHLDFGRGESVLRGVDLHVSPGEVVALVGSSGSGKSTIVDLLIRHLDPDEGRILLDGRNLRDLSLESLRRHVVTVEQHPFVFHTSVAENVRYVRPDATDQEVEAACEAAGIDDFVRGLPDGYETSVGEGGMQLSAGQRQRIALARAFLADPSVLVLDEVTASLDPATEALVVEGYQAMMRGRTTILVSHRPDLATRADRVVVLDQGRIVEEGPPDRLARGGSVFRRILRVDQPATAPSPVGG